MKTSRKEVVRLAHPRHNCSICHRYQQRRQGWLDIHAPSGLVLHNYRTRSVEASCIDKSLKTHLRHAAAPPEPPFMPEWPLVTPGLPSPKSPAAVAFPVIGSKSASATRQHLKGRRVCHSHKLLKVKDECAGGNDRDIHNEKGRLLEIKSSCLPPSFQISLPAPSFFQLLSSVEVQCASVRLVQGRIMERNQLDVDQPPAFQDIF